MSAGDRALLRMLGAACLTALLLLAELVLVALGLGTWGIVIAVVAGIPVAVWLASVWVIWTTCRQALGADSPLRRRPGVAFEAYRPYAAVGIVAIVHTVADSLVGWRVFAWLPEAPGAARGMAIFPSSVIGMCGVVVLAVLVWTRWRRDSRG